MHNCSTHGEFNGERCPACKPGVIQTVNLRPTWRGLLPALVHLTQHGDAEGKAQAWKELYRLADAVDALNAENKK